MRWIFFANDGSLRAGRVAALLLLLLLVLGTVALKWEKPLNHVVVKVRHVFRPSPQDSPSPAEELQIPATSPKKVAEKMAAEVPSITEPGPVKEQPATVEEQASKTLPPSPVPFLPEKPGLSDADPGAPVPLPQKTTATNPPPEVEQSGQDVKELPTASTAQEETFDPDLDVAKEYKQELPTTADTKESVKVLPVSLSWEGKGELNVDRATYRDLFQKWRTSGTEEGVEKISLQVTDLREHYGLFQMKPVAVRSDSVFFDLNDGTRLPPGSLEEYSATVFVVDRPWEKWREALTDAGLRQGTPVEVRYYMYEFIKRAMYARCYRAMEWCIERALIPPDTSVGQVDILGQTYVIRCREGGRFGVFVPVELKVKNGPTVSVPAAAFAGQPDIDALGRAGLL